MRVRVLELSFIYNLTLDVLFGIQTLLYFFQLMTDEKIVHFSEK